VLFCDIADSSGLAQRLDPEAMHQVMDRALRLLAEAVHRYEGTVNQFLGDGLMALFGAPVALEDHAFRAVQAALAIQETVAGCSQQLKQECGARSASGRASTPGWLWWAGSAMTYAWTTAVGDTTNLAARCRPWRSPGRSSSRRPPIGSSRGMCAARPWHP
jgi:class 3 adenylate cyclase